MGERGDTNLEIHEVNVRKLVVFTFRAGDGE